jgi:glycosyltransferase involved in cell wall biosynthesis
LSYRVKLETDGKVLKPTVERSKWNTRYTFQNLAKITVTERRSTIGQTARTNGTTFLQSIKVHYKDLNPKTPKRVFLNEQELQVGEQIIDFPQQKRTPKKKKRASVSVVIITYNRKALLEQTLRALLPQITKGDEVIVVDDGSDDGTDVMMRQYKRVQYHRQPREGYRPATAKNIGLKQARNDCIISLDDDCVPFKGFVKTYRNNFQQGVLLLGGIHFMNKAGNVTHKRSLPIPLLSGELRGGYAGNCCFSQADARHVDFFSEEYNGHYGYVDTDFMLKMMISGVALTPLFNACVKHLWTENDLTFKNFTEHNRALIHRKRDLYLKKYKRLKILFMTAKREDLVSVHIYDYLEKAMQNHAQCTFAGIHHPLYQKEPLKQTIRRIYGNNAPDWVIMSPYHVEEGQRGLRWVNFKAPNPRNFKIAAITCDIHCMQKMFWKPLGVEPEHYVRALNNAKFDAVLMVYEQVAMKRTRERQNAVIDPKYYLKHLKAKTYQIPPSYDPLDFHPSYEPPLYDVVFLGLVHGEVYPLRYAIWNGLMAWDGMTITKHYHDGFELLNEKTGWRVLLRGRPLGRTAKRKIQNLQKNYFVGEKYVEVLGRYGRHPVRLRKTAL